MSRSLPRGGAVPVTTSKLDAFTAYFIEDTQAFELGKRLSEEGPIPLWVLKHEQGYQYLLDKGIARYFRNRDTGCVAITPYGETVVKGVSSRLQSVVDYIHTTIMRDGA